MNKFSRRFHAVIFALLSLGLLHILHLLPVNQMFIDPFSEAIRHHDVMDISFSKFRNHDQANLFDPRIFIINSGITDRHKLSQTLKILQSKGANAIGLDLLIDTLYDNKFDTILQQQLRKVSDIIVMGYSVDEKIRDTSFYINSQSLPFFSDGLTSGYVNLATNDGFSVRAFKPFIATGSKEIPSFSTQLAYKLDSNVFYGLRNRNQALEWINFRRIQPGPSSMIHPINSKKASHYALVDMDKFIADSALYHSNYFKDKVTLIGFCGESEKSLSMSDRYFTPLNEQYTGRSLPDMFGVVIHANIISMLLDKDYINEFTHSQIYLFVFFIFLFNFLCFQKIIAKYPFMHSFYVRLFQVFEFVILFSIAILILAFWSLKLEVFMMATAIILSFELFLIYERNLDTWVENIIMRFRKKGG